MSGWLAVLHVGAVLSAVHVHGSSDLLKKGLSNIERESVAAPTELEAGQIPAWLDGTFIRHSCGAFGEVDSVGSGLQEQGFYNYIDHLFDCFGSGTNFKIQDGEATFTNKYWVSAQKKVYDDFDNKMNDSRVFMRGVLGKFDFERSVELAPTVRDYVTHLVPESYPQVNFWKVGDRVSAWSEGTEGQWINIHTVTGLGQFPFTGDSITEGGANIDNPAHEQMDENGDLWSMVGFYRFTGAADGITEWVIYKVSPDRHRTIVTRHELGQFHLNKCQNDQPYPDLEDRHGYIHSFGMSQRYIVIPMTSWLSDPCSMLVGGTNPTQPFFTGNFQFHEEHRSSLIIIRKSDGAHMGTIRTDAFFVTHMLNTYEDGDNIIMDLLVYPNSDFYIHNARLEFLLQNNIPDGTLERMTLNMNDMSVSRRSLRPQGQSKMEFTQYNQAYNMLPYKYGYFVHNPYMLDSSIVKINVDTGEETAYAFPTGRFPFEPIFVARPEATEEDDGVLLVQVVDTAREKSLLAVLDARTMTLEAQAMAPDMSLFGIHNRYFPCSVGGSGDGDTSACKQNNQTGSAVRNSVSIISPAMTCLLVLYLYAK